MGSVWNLTINTSLPDVCYDDSDLKEETIKYRTFEDTKAGLCDKVRKYAFEDNAMFDGNGYLREFIAFIEMNYSSEDESTGEIDAVSELMKKIISGDKEVSEETVKNTRYEDWMIAAGYEDGYFYITGNGDGPINGVSPEIRTNLFDMNDESKHYYLHIDDYFGGMWGQEVSSELYVDLTYAPVE